MPSFLYRSDCMGMLLRRHRKVEVKQEEVKIEEVPEVNQEEVEVKQDNKKPRKNKASDKG